MLTRPLHHLRRNVVPYLALFLVLAVGAGGGYALAATKTKTITVCADKKTGILHLKTRGRCARGQTRVTWNQQGPQGPQGLQGPGGQPGAPAAAAWAHVLASGAVFAGQGISIQHQSAGTYQLTINAPACAQQLNAPVVTVDSGAPNGQGAGVPGCLGRRRRLESIRCVHGGRDKWIVHAGRQEFYVVDECSCCLISAAGVYKHLGCRLSSMLPVLPWRRVRARARDRRHQ